MRQSVRDYARWEQVVARAISDFHSDWLPALPAELVTLARRSPRGRRMLATRLAAGPAAVTMSVSAVRAINHSPADDWLLQPRDRLRSAVLDVGALALLPGIRVMVDREAVRRIRLALSDARYAWVLEANQQWWDASNQPQIDRAVALLQKFLDQAPHLRHQIELRGAHELSVALAHGHPVLAEKLRLTYPPEWFTVPARAWLPADVALHGLCARESALEARQEATA